MRCEFVETLGIDYLPTCPNQATEVVRCWMPGAFPPIMTSHRVCEDHAAAMKDKYPDAQVSQT